MNAVEIKGLCKTYPDFRLDALTLALPEGCIMGLIGENGAGKSTTIRLLLGMLRKEGGSVAMLGREDGGELPEIREQIGFVPDEVGIPECLNTAQVGKVMRLTFKNWDEALYESLLEKLDIPRGKPFGDFSRGNRMKLGIAAALSHDPKLLILDEATSGLDPVARDEVVEMLSDFTRDERHSVLISSHIVSDLEKICDYIAFLHKGRLLLCEEKDRLQSAYGILRCTKEELDALDPAAILHRKETAYGAEAIVLRDAVRADRSLGAVSIEELFIHSVKGDA